LKSENQDGPQVEELVASFPEWSEVIRKIYLKNRNFREVVKDYLFCKHKLSRLYLEPDENKMLLVEYEKTMKELEEEMKEYTSLENS
jgi:hypothetical protein